LPTSNGDKDPAVTEFSQPVRVVETRMSCEPGRSCFKLHLGRLETDVALRLRCGRLEVVFKLRSGRLEVMFKLRIGRLEVVIKLRIGRLLG
jgi:hypothetical protein